MKNLMMFVAFASYSFMLSAQNDSIQIKISNLTVSNTQVEEGKSISFGFTLKNTGIVALPPDFPQQCELTAWLSKDTILDFDDLDITYFSYDLLASGEESTYQSEFYAPVSLDTGTYYLLVHSNFGYCYFGDEDDQMLLYTPLEIVPFTGLPCTKKIASGIIDCTFYDAAGNFNFIVQNGNSYKSYHIDTSGVMHTNPDPQVPEIFSISIIQGQLVKKNGAGAIVFAKNIPSSLMANYDRLKSAIETGNGFIIAAFKNPPFYPAPSAPNTANLGLTLIRTDNDLNVLATKEWSTNVENAPFLYNFDNQRFALGYSNGTFTFGKGYLKILDAALTEVSSTTLIEFADYSGGWPVPFVPSIKKTLCGDFSYGYYYHSSHLPYMQLITKAAHSGIFNGTSLVAFKGIRIDEYQNSFSTTTTVNFSRKLDSQVLNAAGSIYQSYTEPGLTPTFIEVSETQNGTIVYDDTLAPAQLYPFRELIKTGQHYYLIDQNFSDITLTPVDCSNNEIFVVDVPDIVDNQHDINVFPNPGRESFYITGIKNTCIVSLYDLMGKTMFRQQFTPDPQGGIVIRPGNVPSGTYILQVPGRAVKLIVR